jgi:hypothetical protein
MKSLEAIAHLTCERLGIQTARIVVIENLVGIYDGDTTLIFEVIDMHSACVLRRDNVSFRSLQRFMDTFISYL